MKATGTDPVDASGGDLLVDSHVHLYTADLPLSAQAWTRPEHELSVETFGTWMDEHGVDLAVISAMSLLDNDDYTLQALQADPRLRGTISMPADTSAPALAGLRDRGVVGIRWQWRRRTDLPDLTDPEWRTLLGTVADLGWHIELNIEQDRLEPVLQQLLAAGVGVVIDHFGDPDRQDGYRTPGGTAMLRALAAQQVRVKISAGYRFSLPTAVLAEHAATLLGEGGTDAVFWGSDAPFVGAKGPVSYAGELARFGELVPDPAVRQEISQSARRFYFG